jgi:hypothetical protein
MWAREFHHRTNQEGDGCRKVEIFGLHGGNGSIVEE